jgi:hypothetical protein
MTWNTSLIDGPLTIPTYGLADTETGERPVTGSVPGYSLNLPNYLLTEELRAFQVFPETPAVVFAGQETAFLHFVDEDEAKTWLPEYWDF